MGGLIDAKGRAISTQEIARVKRTAEMTDREGRFFHPNDGASHRGTFMRGWYANIQSADADTFWDRDTLVARARDIARNTPVGKSVTQRKVNAVVGFKWRLSPRLSARALGVTPDQARELRSQISAKFNAWAYGPTFTADAERTKTFGQVLRASAFHLVQDGEALILVEYAGDEPTKYKTRARIVDPDRLSNPAGRPNTLYLRGGVERTLNLIPWRYWIRERHPADLIGTIETFQWRPWLRHATPEGRPQVLHAYDQKRAGLTRGVTEFVACLRYMKALDKFSDATLQATTLNALQLGVIKTQSGVDAIKEGFDVEDFRGYTEDRSAWHEKNTVKLDDAAFQVLAPGDEAEMLTTARETAGFADFTRSILRLIAASLGVTYEEMTMDFSQTNYSSARAALSIAWQEILALRGLIKAQIADQLYMAWLEEAIELRRDRTAARLPDLLGQPRRLGRMRMDRPGARLHRSGERSARRRRPHRSRHLDAAERMRRPGHGLGRKPRTAGRRAADPQEIRPRAHQHRRRPGRPGHQEPDQTGAVPLRRRRRTGRRACARRRAPRRQEGRPP